MKIYRYAGVASLVVALGLVATGCTPPSQTPEADEPTTKVPMKPSHPVKLNIFDGGGRVATEPIIDSFVEKHPDIISSVSWETAADADTVSVLKPQVDSGNLKIDFAVIGAQGMASGIVNNLWTPIVKRFSDRLSNMKNFNNGAKQLQENTKGYAVNMVSGSPGPIIAYNADVVAEEDVPTTAEELLAWVEKNPGKFGYANPETSGIGRAFLLGLPYILGEKEPRKPSTWDKTWDYLAKLGKGSSYPASTRQMITNIADGTWDIMPESAGWYIGQRVTGALPANVKVAPIKDTTYILDSQFVAIPRGVSADKQAAILQLIQYMLTPEANAMTYNTGQYYPGPVIKGVTIEDAPSEMQEAIKPIAPEWLAKTVTSESTPMVPSLGGEALVEATTQWKHKIGSGQ